MDQNKIQYPNQLESFEQFQNSIEKKSPKEIQIYVTQNFDTFTNYFQSLGENDIISIKDYQNILKIIIAVGISALFPMSYISQKIKEKKYYESNDPQIQQKINLLFQIHEISRRFLEPILQTDENFFINEEQGKFWQTIQDLQFALLANYDDDSSENNKFQKNIQQNLLPNVFNDFYCSIFQKKCKLLKEEQQQQRSQNQDQLNKEINHRIYLEYQDLVKSIPKFIESNPQINQGEKLILINMQRDITEKQLKFSQTYKLENLIKEYDKEQDFKKSMIKLQKSKIQFQSQIMMQPQIQYQNLNKLQLQEENKQQQQPQLQKLPCCYSYYEINKELNIMESLNVDYKDYYYPFSYDKMLILKKLVCGFLNSKGGTILLGIDDDSVVKGITLSYKEQDEINVKYFNEYIFKNFDPRIQLEQLQCKVEFVPVKDQNKQWMKGQWVIRVKVNQGTPNTLYTFQENQEMKCYIRMNGSNTSYKNVEFKHQLILRYINPLKVDQSHICVEPDQTGQEMCTIKRLLQKKDFFNKKEDYKNHENLNLNQQQQNPKVNLQNKWDQIQSNQKKNNNQEGNPRMDIEQNNEKKELNHNQKPLDNNNNNFLNQNENFFKFDQIMQKELNFLQDEIDQKFKANQIQYQQIYNDQQKELKIFVSNHQDFQKSKEILEMNYLILQQYFSFYNLYFENELFSLNIKKIFYITNYNTNLDKQLQQSIKQYFQTLFDYNENNVTQHPYNYLLAYQFKDEQLCEKAYNHLMKQKHELAEDYGYNNIIYIFKASNIIQFQGYLAKQNSLQEYLTELLLERNYDLNVIKFDFIEDSKINIIFDSITDCIMAYSLFQKKRNIFKQDFAQSKYRFNIFSDFSQKNQQRQNTFIKPNNNNNKNGEQFYYVKK